MSEMSVHGSVSPHGGDTCSISELRIVLLGRSWAGKSSAGNTILGREEFTSVGKCSMQGREEGVKKVGEVAGRQVTVVDVQGWNRYSAQEIIERTLQSVSLCSPGPHAFLLVIDVFSMYTEDDRRSMEKCLRVLGETVWNHTIVLFTFGDKLENSTVEQHIERGGESLQWIVKECGNRYHVLNNRTHSVSQVTMLLEKIEKMVAENGGCYPSADIKQLSETEMKRCIETLEEEMEITRMQAAMCSWVKSNKSHKQRETSSVSELRIVLLGRSWAGKTSAGNTILGREEFTSVGKRSMQGREEGVKKVGEVAGRQVTVVDTQGWCGYSAQEIIERTLQSISLCSPGPHAFLLVIDVFTMFTEDDRRSMEKCLRVLGETVWSYTIVLFTFGDKLENSTIEQHIERGGESLQWLLRKCGNRYHVLNNRKRGSRSQVTTLLEKIEKMVAENGGCSADIKQFFNDEMKQAIETLEEEMAITKTPSAWEWAQKDYILKRRSMEWNKPNLSEDWEMNGIGKRNNTLDSGRGSLYSLQSIQECGTERDQDQQS
ncbi:GTPase IMAP family member 8-like isoform X2 [Megalops cyprinoides]|uniref:GTPase IMAP family member 8-like isoform X2 n=1 Tax=Megalops cyprinoides TaxID=118141 RepID=UPI001863A58F|nr:GTPase IMAP family member 8-like isoform X2 [Megalops cyprinoides]